MLLLFLLATLSTAQNIGDAPNPNAPTTCPASCIYKTTSGATYDLSGFKGQVLSHTDESSGNTYTLALCGTAPTTCPITTTNTVGSGMAVQDGSGGCYVLGVYGKEQTCAWSDSGAALQLKLANGTPEYCGSPRTLTIDFTCPKDASALIPTAWNATNPEGTCDYIYSIPTCAVCKGGCSGGGWGAMFLILLLGVCLPVYLIAGMIYNYVKREYRGKELCNGLAPVYYVGLCKDGVAFLVGGCKAGSGSSDYGGSGGSGSGGSAQASKLSGDASQPYQNI